MGKNLTQNKKSSLLVDASKERFLIKIDNPNWWAMVVVVLSICIAYMYTEGLPYRFS
jgi:1,4-dihydroxy-2-naphthoate octaprenyltransferase